MRCQSCGTENRADRKFCRECGASLAAACPSCGAANEADDKFCGSCGTALGAAPPPAAAAASSEPERAEQRFVSVLFADMVGYTTLSEDRDSEDIRDLLTRYFDRSREIIERFGGSVEKFIGDAVMGVWGATGAREDDAQRAVRAALELVDMVAALGDEAGIPELRLRAGVNSGQTSVGPGGNEKGLVVGDLVNVASRLESLAASGTVNVGPATEAVSKAAIDYEYLGEKELKGKTETVPVWRALRVAAMRGGRGEDVRVPPFVGRERELRLLKDALTGVETDSRARLLSIIGEAGIGKTRLAEEFRNHIDGYTQTIYWHWGRSPSYGEGVTFWALGEMVRRRAGIVEGEDPARSLTRLRTTLAEFVPSEEDRQWIEPRLAGLLGLAEMPSGTRQELFAALRSFFQHISEKGATVLVFEDMHWADPGLIEFVGELVERSGRSPILVVTLARPDLLEDFPTWGTQHRSAMAVRLGPLNDDEMSRMLRQYLKGAGDDVIERIAERSTGFPLYAVEIVRMLSASGDLVADGDGYRYEGDVAEMALPETLQTVIGARLDRLDADERSLLQDGAVLGQFFTLDGMATLRDEPADQIEAALAPLIQWELLELEDDPRSPERGQYRFVQPLIHEVAYQRLTRSDRRSKHLAVAEYYANLHDPELAGFVAGHYMGAYEATPDGTEKEEMVARAMEELTNAAGRAIELHSYRQGVELLEEAIELAPDEGACFEQRLQAAFACSDNNDPDRGLGHLAEARKHAEQSSDPDDLRRVATTEANVLNSHYRSDQALEAIRDAYEGLDEIEGPVAVALAGEAARSFSLTQHPEEAIVAVDRMLPAASDTETILNGLVSKATALAWMGRKVEAYTLLRGAAEEGQIRGQLYAAGRALNNLAAIVQNRNPQESARIADVLGELIAKFQNVSWMVRQLIDTADWAIDDGRYDDAVAGLEDVKGEELSEFWQRAVDLHEERITLRTMGDRAAFDRAWDAVVFYDDEADPQIRAGFEFYKSMLRRDIGEWEASFDFAMEVDTSIFPAGVWAAVHAAAWLRDEARLDQAAAALETCPDPFPRLGEYIEAVRMALAGDTAAASARFTEAMVEWPVRLLSGDLAQARATFALLVGLDDPAAAQAAADVDEWLTATGTAGLRDVWAAALPASAQGTSSAAG